MGRIGTRLFEWRGPLHRIAAILLVGASLAHIAYLAFTARGGEFLGEIAPRREDLTDALAVLQYNLRLTDTRPQFGRFSYVEKCEYWALVWGTLLMSLTGPILWFEETFIGPLNKLGWDVARTIHFYEAWLATLAILVWHTYYAIFNPDVYPMNLAWLTGTISEAEMAKEHPLELAEIRRRRAEEQARAAEAERRALEK
ncbi:MAG: cytochrome b/b6 domain-containing protein [Acidobacteria bacterium]|nr:cytochrome b/b6 domain-containing protein [Acidobacteriota bacterium]